jgi:hypothetical protein
MASTYPRGTHGSVASLLAAPLYQEIPDRNHTRSAELLNAILKK